MNFPTTEMEADDECQRLRELDDMDWGDWRVPDDDDLQDEGENMTESYIDDDYPMPPDVLAEHMAALETPDEPPPNFRWWRAIRAPGRRSFSRESVSRLKPRVRTRSVTRCSPARARHQRQHARKAARKVTSSTTTAKGSDDPAPPPRSAQASDLRSGGTS
jgi:hypothetical protein